MGKLDRLHVKWREQKAMCTGNAANSSFLLKLWLFFEYNIRVRFAEVSPPPPVSGIERLDRLRAFSVVRFGLRGDSDSQA